MVVREESGKAGPLQGVLTAQLTDRPPTRTSRQQRAGPGHVVALLGDQPARAVGLGAAPGPLAPPQLDRPAEARRVYQPHHPTAVTAHHDPADPAALDPRGRLHVQGPRRPVTSSTAVTCSPSRPTSRSQREQ